MRCHNLGTASNRLSILLFYLAVHNVNSLSSVEISSSKVNSHYESCFKLTAAVFLSCGGKDLKTHERNLTPVMLRQTMRMILAAVFLSFFLLDPRLNSKASNRLPISPSWKRFQKKSPRFQEDRKNKTVSLEDLAELFFVTFDHQPGLSSGYKRFPLPFPVADN